MYNVDLVKLALLSWKGRDSMVPMKAEDFHLPDLHCLTFGQG